MQVHTPLARGISPYLSNAQVLKAPHQWTSAKTLISYKDNQAIEYTDIKTGYQNSLYESKI